MNTYGIRSKVDLPPPVHFLEGLRRLFWVGGDKTQAKPESPPTQKKAELRIVRVRVPPSDGTEARGGSLGRARMWVCVCGTLACDLEYEVCSGRRLLRMLGFCLRIVTYLWEITGFPLE